MTDQQTVSLADRIVADLERQLSEGDPRYGAKCRQLAVVNAQYQELMEFVEKNAEVLGLKRVDASGQELTQPDLDNDATIAGEVSDPDASPREKTAKK